MYSSKSSFVLLSMPRRDTTGTGKIELNQIRAQQALDLLKYYPTTSYSLVIKELMFPFEDVREIARIEHNSRDIYTFISFRVCCNQSGRMLFSFELSPLHRNCFLITKLKPHQLAHYQMQAQSFQIQCISFSSYMRAFFSHFATKLLSVNRNSR